MVSDDRHSAAHDSARQLEEPGAYDDAGEISFV